MIPNIAVFLLGGRFAPAPEGMALTSGKGFTAQAQSDLDLVGQCHARLSAGKGLWLRALEGIGVFAHRLGMKLIAASGNMSLQAQDGELEAIATKALRLQSLEGELTLDAKTAIVLRSGKAQIRIADGKIEFHSPGEQDFKGSAFTFGGPASVEGPARSFKASTVKTDERFRIVQAGQPVKGIRYQITLENGQVLEGRSDDDGYTQVAKSELAQRARLKLFPDDVAE